MTDTSDPESLGFCPQRLTRLDDWLSEQVESQRLPGASVQIGRRGQLAYQAAVGYADVEQQRPFTLDAIVRLYSMTKPITSVAAMMLYEAGAFQLDDPVARYLPGFGETRVWAGGNAPLSSTGPQQRPMQVRDLMTHSSGLTYDFMRSNVVDQEYRQRGIDMRSDALDLASWCERLADIPLMCQPGSQWNYSVSTDVLGRLVEVWSGQSLADFFQRSILKPLAMQDTGFHVADGQAHRFAALYSPLSGAALGVAAQHPERVGLALQEGSADSSFLAPPAVFSGGGGLVGTLKDYARFCQLMLNEGELDGVRLLSPMTVRSMRSNHLPDNRDMAAMGQPVWSETNYEGIGFGLGFAVVLDPNKAGIIASRGEHHWGGAASTFFWLDPEQDLYVVFLTQLMPSSAYPIRRELRARVYQALVA